MASNAMCTVASTLHVIMLTGLQGESYKQSKHKHFFSDSDSISFTTVKMGFDRLYMRCFASKRYILLLVFAQGLIHECCQMRDCARLVKGQVDTGHLRT